AHTSSNAHNIWWVVGGWQNSEVPMLGPLTATQISMVLFAVFYLALLGKIFLLWRGDRPGNATALSQVPGSVGSGGLREPQALAMVLLVAMTFFMVATHMHENHMFAALPLALPLVLVRGPLGRRGIVIYAAVSLAVLFNIVSHDPRLTLHAPFTWGGETGTDNLHLHRPMLVGERWAIRFSTVWNLAVLGGLLIWSFLPNGLLDRLGQVEDRPAAAQ
ncbi:MAG: hypothetical protein KC729_14000, partial [Candidatus Eisenbacteria bacterium]|nr:hypothetical protein [Candidatus Eisenbacteria bacterium]